MLNQIHQLLTRRLVQKKEEPKANKFQFPTGFPVAATGPLLVPGVFARLPASYPRGEIVDNGGLMSYGPDPDESLRRVTSMIDKILKGAKPADLPVEQPTKFELAFNLKTAKQIGVIIPQGLLYRADKVIK